VKKVFPILMAFIIFVLPFGGLKAFAYSGGLLDGKPLTMGDDVGVGSTTTSILTDGNLTNMKQIGSFGSSDDVSWYHFSSPVIIDGARLKGSVVTVRLYNSSKVLLYTVPVTNNDTRFDFTAVPNVSYVALLNGDSGTGVNVNEFDVFGSAGAIVHTDISNLITTVNNNAVTITYDLPSGNADFTGSKIYRDGVLISTQNNLSGSFVDSGLSYDTSYSYKVTATYSDGFETSGVIDSVVIGSLPTDPATIPPSNITSLMVSDLSGTGATLNWSNSTDIDLASVNIYLDGLVVTNIPLSSSYVLTGLTASTQYNYGVALVDNDGNVSSIVSTVFTTLGDTDIIAPGQVTGVSAEAGNSALYVKWSANTDSDLSGYNVYIDGVKFNTSVIKNTFLTVTDLVNDQSYDVEVSAVDLSGNEGVKSSISSGIPLASKLPLISMDYTLSDVADAVSSWFTSQWLILAFAISIPLSFYIASRVKLLFLD
jgi:hypothetical protein